MAQAAYREGDFESWDGTRIRWQSYGDGRPIVLANGLGGTFAAWRHVYEALGDRYRVYCWDYRGLYNSAAPADRARVTVSDHCRDLEVLLEREEIDDALFVGWSMGTQVNFEFHRQHGARFRGLILLNGTCGSPFDTALGIPGSKKLILGALELMRRFPQLVSKSSQVATSWSHLVPVLQQFGLVGKSVDLDVFGDLVGDFINLDFEIYARILQALGDHDACDVVPSVRCPVLIITGDRDVMTPVATAQRMQKRLADCTLEVIPEATHYAAVEFPDRVIGAIENYLERIAY